MENCKLDEKRISELRTLWASYLKDMPETEKNKISEQVPKINEQWKIYREKIRESNLTLREYTNIKANDDANLPGNYLCNFLERTTPEFFGSSKPGNANNFEVKMNNDGKTYSILKHLSGSKVGGKTNESEARYFYEKNVKTILENIIKCEHPLGKIDIVEGAEYAAKQFLRKIAVLEHPCDFLSIYSDETIDELYREFSEEKQETNLENKDKPNKKTNLKKNYEIRQIVDTIFELDSSEVTRVLISRFLWKFANTKEIVDKDTPNVIFYGPPGTGKTYEVKKSLDFVCQGDRTRYEIVQFHPSFTYEDFIDGIKPKGVSSDGNIKFELVNGIFKSFCQKAKKNPQKLIFP
ncbi:AAA family ATPase [Glaciecola sp. 1036]|uniref:AAA family ATPase n=1 Tax=Alteromonadaceae TaxID=72275 RepID=UPI003D021EB0